MQSTQQYRLFCFDTEATSFRDAGAVIEVAVKDLTSSNTYASLVRPNPFRRNHPDAVRVHGITDSMLQQPKAVGLLDAWQQMIQFIERHTPQGVKPVLVAYNGLYYDFYMLVRDIYKVNNQATAVFWAPADLLLVDPWPWVKEKRHLLPRLADMKQGTVYQYFMKRPQTEAHRALGDAHALGEMLPHLLQWAATAYGATSTEHLISQRAVAFDDFAVTTLKASGWWQGNVTASRNEATAARPTPTQPAASATAIVALAITDKQAPLNPASVAEVAATAGPALPPSAVEVLLKLESQDANALGMVDATLVDAALMDAAATDEGCMVRLESQDANAAVGDASMLAGGPVGSETAAHIQQSSGSAQHGSRKRELKEQQAEEEQACKKVAINSSTCQ